MVKIARESQVTIVELGADYNSLDEEALSRLSATLLKEAGEVTPPVLLVDLSGVNFIASNFLEILVRAWKRIKQRDGVMALCGVTPFCAEVLKITRLNSLWAAFPNRAEAVAQLSSQANVQSA